MPSARNTFTALAELDTGADIAKLRRALIDVNTMPCWPAYARGKPAEPCPMIATRMCAPRQSPLAFARSLSDCFVKTDAL
jgi:hypothetical protein